MEVIIVKRDGSEMNFDRTKIVTAVEKALLEVDGNLEYGYLAYNAARSVESYLEYYDPACITVEEIQDLVEQCLIEGPRPDVAKSYIRYRYKRELARNNYKELMESDCTKAMCVSSCLECLPYCNSCAYQPYCGTCPVINLAQDGSIFSKNPKEYRCNIYGGLLDILFDYIENDKEAVEIFYKWIN